MDKKFYRIDELSRGTLGDLEKDPPPMSFDKIRKRVFWYSFWSLSVGSFVRRFWGIPLAAAIVGVVIYQLIPSDKLVLNGVSAFSEEKTLLQQKNPAYENLQIAENSESEIKNTDNNQYNIAAPVSDNPDKEKQTTVWHPREVHQNDLSLINTTDMLPETENISSKEANPTSDANETTLENQNPAVSFSSSSIFGSQSILPMKILSGQIPQPMNKEILFAEMNSKERIKGSRQLSWSLLAGGGFVYSGAVFSPVSEDQPAISRNFSFSTSANLEARADFGHWFLSAGLQQTSIDNRYSSAKLLYNERTVFEQSLSNQYWTVDSIGFWHYTYIYDTTIHVVDSVWQWDYDSLLVSVYDSLAVLKSDTINSASWKRNVRYLEIPVMIGKTFSYNRFVFGLSGGFGFGILYQSKGEYFSGGEDGNGFAAFTVSETKKPCISFMARGSVSFLLNEHLSIELYPWYRRMLSTIDTGETEGAQKPWSAGLSTGLRIYF
ncbi:hypothetical protein SDC9_67859 [bioreactor metagenome]|uniref:Outer membrane protein beta-barrel domain-containing protein n=1 Tax=bioreactor metagenome TaxID=1076179 RepID=A0A644XYT6_9ZZZZ